MIASSAGSYEAVVRLVEQGAKVDAVNEKGQTSLWVGKDWI